MILSPSILSADFGILAEQVKRAENAGAQWLHIDVMDGHFVPNMTFAMPVIKSLRKYTDMFFDVHLMIENPDKYAGDFVTPNTEFITVHQEACTHLHRSIQNIKSLGVKAGVALNPATHLGTLDYVIDDVDMILGMSVNPGFGGQKFIPKTLEKVRELAEIRAEEGLDFEIEIDGGITLDNVKEVTDAGVSVVVAGSSVFVASDIEARVREFVKW